jgi:O-acetylserine/cysteine efflux transporter
MSLTPHHFLLMLVINLFWALTVIAVAVGLEDLPPFLFSCLRFLLLAVLLLPFLEAQKGRMAQIAVIAISSGALQFALLYGGIYVAEDVSAVALASQLGVPFATLLSIVFLGEVVRWRRWAGIILAFAGVMVLSFDPRVLAYIDGILFGIAAAFVAAIGAIFMRRLKDVTPYALQAWIAMISWPPLLLLSMVVEGDTAALINNAGWVAWGTIVFSALASNLVAHAGMFWLLQRYEVSTLSPLTLMSPVLTVILAVALLGDVLTWRMALGGAITLVGVGIILLRRPEAAVEEVKLRR